MNIEKTKVELLEKINTLENPRDILKDKNLKNLYAEIPKQTPEKRGEFGKQVNEIKLVLEARIESIEAQKEADEVELLDVTAPFDVNSKKEPLNLTGSRHPLITEINEIVDIFNRMGYEAQESRQIDDDWHMFGSLNFPDGHPARDGYDTFRTEEGFIPPAHTSTMENRVLSEGREKLEKDGYLAHVSYGRVFRNENTDATHEHTFYQIEGVYVSKTATVGDLTGTLREFFKRYYGEDLAVKTQPAYFPFTEPGFEFMIEKPVALGGKPGEWLEIGGCGMSHPNVLKAAGINPDEYRGFAFGLGIERMVMLKYGINDVRLFESCDLRFLKQFK